MDARDLEVFLAVVKCLNFTRAGEEVHLSQPSVSVRIRMLEEELKVKLFEQVNKKVVLLDAGHILESHARRVVAALEDTRRAIDDFRGLEVGAIKIAASTTPGMYLVPRVIAEFKMQHPQISISLSTKNTRQAEIAVVKNECDLGFVGGHLIGDNIQSVPWRTDEIVLVVPPNHHLAKKKRITLSNLSKEQLLYREQGSATRAEVEKIFASYDFHLRPAADLDNPEAVKQAVAGGLGIAFVSKFSVEAELKAKTLIAIRVHGLSIKRELKIIYRKGKPLSRAAGALIETAQRM